MRCLRWPQSQPGMNEIAIFLRVNAEES